MPNIGDILTGKVQKIYEKKATIVLSNGERGTVHISEVSWGFVTDINEFLKVGDEVKVKVIFVKSDEKKIGLSIKQTQEREHKKPFRDQKRPPREMTEEQKKAVFDKKLERYLKESGRTIKEYQRRMDSKRGGGKKEQPRPKKK